MTEQSLAELLDAYGEVIELYVDMKWRRCPNHEIAVQAGKIADLRQAIFHRFDQRADSVVIDRDMAGDLLGLYDSNYSSANYPERWPRKQKLVAALTATTPAAPSADA